MRRWFCTLPLLWLVTLTGCGGNNTSPTNVGLFGDWNIVMDPTGSQNPVYVLALAMSQEGPNYSGGSITYTGSVAVPANMCIDAQTLTAQAMTSGSDFTTTITDSSSNAVISVTGSLATQTGSIAGTYANAGSASCPASQGTVVMTPQ